MDKFREGSAAYNQRRYKDAIDLFLEANAIVENAAFAYNAAIAYDAMGDSSQALRWYREYLRRAPDATDRAEVAKNISNIEVQLREKGLMQISVLSQPSGATVLVDGQAVGVTTWTGEIIPGAHRVELRLRGYEDVSRTVELPADHAVDVNASMPMKAGPGWILPTSIAVLGAAVVSGAIAVGLESARSDAEDAARRERLQVDAADDYDRMESLQLGARTSAGIAGGLAVVGSALLVIDLSMRGSEPEPAVGALHVGCGPTLCTASYSGTF